MFVGVEKDGRGNAVVIEAQAGPNLAALYVNADLAGQVRCELERIMAALQVGAGMVALRITGTKRLLVLANLNFPEEALLTAVSDSKPLLDLVLRRRSPYLSSVVEATVPTSQAKRWHKLGKLLTAPLQIEVGQSGLIALGAPLDSHPLGEQACRQIKGLIIPLVRLLQEHHHALDTILRWRLYSESMLDELGYGLIGLDAQGRVAIWSRGAEATLSLTPQQAQGRDFEEVMRQAESWQDGSASAAVSEWARELLTSNHGSYGYQFSYGPAHAPRVLELNGAPVRDQAGQPCGAALLVQDITEQRQIEDQMEQVTQLAALGYLAANVAHEIRNPLSAIKAAAQYLQRECEDNPLIAQFAGIIDEESNRLTKVVTDFLIYARPQPPRLVPTHLPELANRCLTLLEHELARARVTVTLNSAPDLPVISADPEQLQQVLLNLCSNALQAMEEEGGELRIEMRPGSAQLADWPHPCEVIELMVADTGCGILREDMSQIFTPFFTTKTKGSGLGLAIVRRIVEAHEGGIDIQSEPGMGTHCRIFLPVSPAARTEHQTKKAQGSLIRATEHQLTLLEAVESYEMRARR